MDPVRNPYSPGAGRPPAALVGRDAELASWIVSLTRLEQGRGAQPLALYGLRGVGKTVLLTRLAREAESRDWITAQIEAGAGRSMRAALGEALYGPLSDMVRPHAGKRLLRALKTALSFKASYDTSGTWTFGIDLDQVFGGGADSGVLETDLAKLVKDLSAAAKDDGAGLAILIDEAQDLAQNELVALCSIAHQASQHGWPFLLAIAGLPSLPRDVAEAKSYAERLFDFHHVTALNGAKATDALTMPAHDAGVAWTDDAARHIVDTTGGYPYFLQQYGQDTWNQSDGPTITLSDARIGEAHGRAALDTGFFRSRWDRATRAEQQYLRAMAEDGDGGSQSSEIARRLTRTPASLGPARAGLIAKGLVYSPEHGQIAFTVPGMAGFITRQPEQ